jgi:plasmid stabilization system protein ParE
LNRVNIQPLAYADAEEAAAWYEGQRAGLGIEFVLELDVAIERAGESPELYELQYREARRVLLRRFPYAVYFVFEHGVVEVFAILHQHREPSLWKSRVP